MKADVDNIKMYWWEGFYGFNHLFQRIIKRKRPFIRNFGDMISPLVVSLLTGKKVSHTTSSNKLLALGSIFFALSDKDSVWGSGFLNAKHIKFALSAREVNYLAVRGPETRKLLTQHNITCPEIFGDPAILLPQLIKNDILKKHLIGIVPHFSQYQYFLEKMEKSCMHVINVENSLAEVMQDILSCEIIVSTSLHGLIVAEAYDIPALMLSVNQPSPEDLFKFEDYFHSTNRSLTFVQFDSSKISTLPDLALNQKKPKVERNSLLEVFPYKRSNLNLTSPILCWSNLNRISFKHSILPPRFSVPL